MDENGGVDVGDTGGVVVDGGGLSDCAEEVVELSTADDGRKIGM